MRKLCFTLTALLLCCLALELTAAPKKKSTKAPPPKLIEKHQDNLHQLEEEIRKRESRVGTLKRRESSIVVTLEQLERRIEGSMQRRRDLEERRRQIEAELADKGAGIREREAELARLNETVGFRLRQLYRLGDIGYIRLFLTLNDLRDLAEGNRLVQRIVSQDMQAIAAFQRERDALQYRQQVLLSNRQNLKDVLADLEEQNQEIQQQRKRQKQLLGMTRSQRDFYSRSAEELREAAANLQTMIDKMVKEGYASDFAIMKGMLGPPIDAPLSGTFGRYVEPRFRTMAHRNGLEFRARPGQEVRAVYAGKVIYSGWFTGYGKIIIVDHGDNYYSMSAHFEKTLRQVGDKVDAGDPLGLSGESGSLKGPLFYFELRHRGQAFDPLPWLNRMQVRRGR